jgi:two-component system, LytTR family, response regulator
MKVKTILVDDEPLAVAELQAMLKSHDDIEVVAVSYDANDALSKIQQFQPQLIFLDINMPGKSGFDLLSELDEAPEVIFVTAYDQFAIKAFEVNALDYILKPVNPDRLTEAIAKIKKKFNNSNQTEEKLTIHKRIFIKDGEQCFFVPLSDIYFIESVGNYARVYYQDKSRFFINRLITWKKNYRMNFSFVPAASRCLMSPM